jgi:CheY-like chemotaxis protein
MSKILIVDEDVASQMILSSELKNEGYSVEAVESAEHALELMRQTQFDLVITEIRFGHECVFELIKQVKSVKLHRPNSDRVVAVIALTAFANLTNAIECQKFGADDFVSKPYELTDLLVTIERVLNS